MQITKKVFSLILILAILIGSVPFSQLQVSAVQSCAQNYYKISLTGNGATDLVNAGLKQLNRTRANIGYTEAWCDNFVCDSARVAGISTNIIPTDRGAVSDLYNYMLNKCGATKVSSPQKGDLVFYYCTSSSRWAHVAIMVDSNSSVHGNVNNKVMQIGYRNYLDTIGNCYTCTFVRPKYADSASTSLKENETVINGKVYDMNTIVSKIPFSCACGIPLGQSGHVCCYRYVEQAYAYFWGKGHTNSQDDLLYGGTLQRNAENIKKCLTVAKPGAHLRTVQPQRTSYGHSMMFLKLIPDGSGAYMLNCNCDGKGSIKVQKLTWQQISNQMNYKGGGYESEWIWAVWYPGAASDKIIPTVTKPSAPTLAVSASDIAVGDSVTVTWKAVSGATSYKIVLSDGQTQTVTGTSCAFKLNKAGKYSAVGYAINSSYTSNQSAATSTVTAHNPSTVVFKDFDGTVLATQTIAYNKSATAPTGLTRKGYTFTGWDNGYTNVKNDIVVTATYKINSYNVRFFDKSGKQLGTTQKVTFGSNAVPPENKNEPNGYIFYGWNNQNYINVGNDGGENGKTYDIYGIYQWYDDDLPISVEIVSATREEDGYYILFNLANYPTAKTKGRAVVTLKTKEGKLVDTTESAAFSIAANGTKKNMEVFVPCEKSASQMEVIVVNSYSSGVPISKSACITSIDNSALWSDWSTEQPDPAEVESIQSRTEYRYRDKNFTTSSSASLDGWTQYDHKITYSSTKTSTSYIASNANREVTTRTVPAVYKTQYVYKRYKYWHAGQGKYYYSYGSGYANANGYKGSWETLTLDYQLSVYNYYDGVPGYLNGSALWFRADSCNKGSFQISTLVSAAYTVYDYRDITHTYSYYQWGSWTDWSDSLYTSTSNREVQTRTTYRAIGHGVSSENNDGVARVHSGKLDPTFAGRYVTLYVYKVTEASDWTNEYIGQTVIEADGSYSFSYKLREEPTIESGDYTVAIGIEATTDLIVVDTIKAPLPKYTLNFYDKYGNIVSTQVVEKGSNGVAPVLDEVTGFTFACWDNSFTNVQGNLDIMPVYIAKQYAVVLINWDNDTVTVKNFNYGDALILDVPDVSEGYDFIGWDAILSGTTTVTDNMIITAKIEKQKFNVSFMDYEGNVIDSQIVEYGDSPIVPELSDDTYVFLSWNGNYETLQQHNDGYDLFYITDTVYYTPEYVYSQTVATPTASVSGGRYLNAQYVELNCEDSDAVIYYTTDGSDPSSSKTAKQYRYPILASDRMTLRFYACAFEKNDSDFVTETYITTRSPRVEFFELDEEIANNADPDHYDVTNMYRQVKFVDATFVTLSKEEASSLIDAGWIQVEGETEYSDFNDWAIRETIDEDLIDVITETQVIEGVTYSRYKSKILHFIRYGYSDTAPADKEIISMGVYTCDYKYPSKVFADINSRFDATTYTIEKGSYITSDMIKEYAGYTFVGLTDENGVEWDLSKAVDEDVFLTANYSLNSYDVTFYNYYGEVYTVKSISYGDAVEAPVLPIVDGYVFVGWDTALTRIEATTEVRPNYVPKSEYAYVSLDYSSNQMSVGHTWKLNATVTPDELAPMADVVWQSSDPSVASVDCYGNVTALSAGTVVISVTVEDSRETAECTIKVLANPAVQLILKEDCYLEIFGKTLRNLAINETVSDIKNQFENTNIEIRDKNNNVLSDDAKVGTGSTICLVNSNKIIDSLTVVRVGDMDGNGKIGTRDVSMLMRYLVNKETPDEYQLAAMDVNGDGMVNNKDAAMTAQFLVGKSNI